MQHGKQDFSKEKRSHWRFFRMLRPSGGEKGRLGVFLIPLVGFSRQLTRCTSESRTCFRKGFCTCAA